MAKRFLEDYYHKLAVRTSKRFSQDDSTGRSKSGKLTKNKRRCVSFNQTELQRNKLKSSNVREGRTHLRRMSVDVGLFLGQKELQVQASRSPLELSPTQGSSTREDRGSSTDASMAERSMEDDIVGKHSRRKRGSMKLKRSGRIGSVEAEDEPCELPSSVTLPQPSQLPANRVKQDVPQPSQLPAPRVRQGVFNRRSLRKTVSDDASGGTESGHTLSVLEKQNSVGGGKAEKKSKFASSFPRRQWSWKSKKTDVIESDILSQSKPQLYQRSCSDVGEKRKSSQNSLSKEGTAILENHTEETVTSIGHKVGDSWSSPTPNRAFTKHTSL